MSAEEDRLFPAFIKVFVERGVMRVEIFVNEKDYKKIKALHNEIIAKHEMNGVTDNNICANFWYEEDDKLVLISSLFCYEDGFVSIRSDKLVSLKDLFTT